MSNNIILVSNIRVETEIIEKSLNRVDNKYMMGTLIEGKIETQKL